MSKSKSTAAAAATKPAAAAATKAAAATATANVLAMASGNNTATPTAKVPASVAVLASITAAPTVNAGTLPGKWSQFAGYTVQLTAKGSAAPQLQTRMADTVKHGPCPFAVALFNGNGKTLAEAWAKVTATGHGQQGRGSGGYTAANALQTYIKNGWFVLVAPGK